PGGQCYGGAPLRFQGGIPSFQYNSPTQETSHMSRNTAAPKLLIPALKPFYDWAEPFTWLLIRVTVGLMMLPHGIPKWEAGVAATAASALERRGITPAEPLAILIIFLETIGGLCVALGLFTRFFAAAITIEMAVIVYQYAPKFGWTGPGYEYPLM